MRELLHVAAMSGLLVIGVRCGPGDQESADHSHFTADTALLVSERDSLRVCVEVDPALEEQGQKLVETLERELAGLTAVHPDWRSAGFARAPARVERGCPGMPMPSGRMQSKGARLGPGLALRPSPYRTFVYILGEAKAQEVLGEQPAVRAHAELMRVSDHMTAEVSSALVVRASALGTESFRQTWLPNGVGLKALREAEPSTPESVK